MKDFLVELLCPCCHDWVIKNPIPVFEKWGFHDLATLAPPKIERRKPGENSSQQSANNHQRSGISDQKLKLVTLKTPPLPT